MKPSLPRSRIQAILRERYSENVSLDPVREGEESQVFAFRHAGSDWIVRVGPSDEAFYKDRFAHRHFNSADLPIPEVAAIQPLEGGLFLCISRRAPGMTLEDLDEASLGRIQRPVADLMESMAASPVESIRGFGVFDADGGGSDFTWRGFLTAIADRGRFDWRRAARGPIAMSEIDPLLDRVCELSAFCPEARQLIHGDFGSNNVLTDAGAITGVIDWSEAAVGDALYDTANILFWRTWLRCMEVQAQHLETRRGGQPNLRERLLCYQLRIGLREVFENSVCNQHRRAAWALRRCRQAAR